MLGSDDNAGFERATLFAIVILLGVDIATDVGAQDQADAPGRLGEFQIRCGHRTVGDIIARDFYFFIARSLDNELPVISFPEKSVHWYQKAATLGQPASLFTLAMMHRDGRILPRDPERAAGLWEMAAERNYGPAALKLAAYYQYRDDDEKRIRWVRAAAKHGYPSAQFSLGFYYLTGKGVPVDDLKSLEWYRRSAAQGNAAAQFGIGRAYAEGRYGGPPDLSEAFVWYQRSAQQGYTKAKADLGWAYIRGRGTQTNPELGAKWLLSAANDGYPEAQLAMGDLYALGWGVDRDLAVSRSWFLAVVNQGDIHAMFRMGVFILSDPELGEGRFVEGLKWIRIAEMSDHPQASEMLEGLQVFLTTEGQKIFNARLIQATIEATEWVQEFTQRGGELFLGSNMTTLNFDWFDQTISSEKAFPDD